MDTGTQASGKTAANGSPEADRADGETLIIVRRGKAKRRDRDKQTRASAFVYSCPGKIWDALVWNCQMSGEHPARAMKDALAAYLKERGWREPPPAKITIATVEPTATEKPPATAGQPAPEAQKPGVR